MRLCIQEYKYLAGIGLIKVVKKDNKQVPHIARKFSIDMFTSEGMEA